MRLITVLLLISSYCFAQQQTVESTDNLNAGRVKINANFTELYTGQSNALVKGTSGADGLYPSASIYRIPGLLNQSSTAVELLNLGSVGTHTGDNVDRVLLPKGFVTINWSQNYVLNWKWNNTLSRAEPYNVAYPMLGWEFGGEAPGIAHFTVPGGIPEDSFHETTRLGGSGVEGLSGVNSLTTYIPFNQFKATIYACYRATTTPDAATTHPWWGGSGNTLSSVLNPLLWLNSEEVKGSGYNVNELARFSTYNSTAYPVLNFETSSGTYQTKTAVATDKVSGEVGSNVHDGVTGFLRTAKINFITRGTISSGVAGQAIQFQTSATNTAGLTNRFEITEEGHIKIISIPTSSAGLASGTLWSDGGTIKIIP